MLLASANVDEESAIRTRVARESFMVVVDDFDACCFDLVADPFLARRAGLRGFYDGKQFYEREAAYGSLHRARLGYQFKGTMSLKGCDA